MNVVIFPRFTVPHRLPIVPPLGCVSTCPFSDRLSVILTKRTFIKKSKICCLSVNDVIVINRKMVEKSDNMVENGLVETQPEAAFRLVF